MLAFEAFEFDEVVYFLFEGRLRPSRTARFALFANYNVENVSALEEIDGDIQTIKLILPLPLNTSLKTRVSLEFLNGIWVRVLSIKAEIQCPNVDRLPFIEVNSCIWRSFSSGVKTEGILNFSEPAKSTIFN